MTDTQVPEFKRPRGLLFKVKADRSTGLYRYRLFGKYIYVRARAHLTDEESVRWLAENIYFKHYRPVHGDTVVDFGAGYGEEAAYLATVGTGLRYVAVEVQPTVFECLSNTFRDLPQGYSTFPLPVSCAPSIALSSNHDYASVGSDDAGCMVIPSCSWTDFVKRFDLKKIDLLKVNIEGAEKGLLECIEDFSIVKRAIISTHDFRANRGHGEHFRTKLFVTELLKSKGFQIKHFSLGVDWGDDWIFAERIS